nr:MAG TPA: hypothetical protein [Inoviridae sp.]
MIKKVLSTLLTLFIIAICPLTAFASVATPSDAQRVPVASSSDASQVYDDFMEENFEVDFFDTLRSPSLMSSGEEGLVYGTDYVYRVRYRNAAGTLKWVNAVYTGGFYRFSPPASGYYPDLLYAQVYKSGLPKTSATYGVTATFLQGNIDFGEYVTSGFCEVYESAQNVTESNFATTGLSYTNTGESYVVKGNVKLTRTSIRVNIGLALKKGVNTTFDISDLSFDFYFKNNADIPVSGNTGYDSSDVVADNTAQMVEKQDTIIDQIVNVTQTISSQLTAFWNQLAGEFTNLYNKLNQQHAEQLEADRTNTDDIIAAEESNTTNIINNNNENTDKLADGYDNSGMQEDNGRLDSALKDYASQEDQVINQAKDKIDGFDYGINFDRLTAPMADISYFLTGIYNGLESLNIPIAFALTLSVALLAIGYYRFKGGA